MTYDYHIFISIVSHIPEAYTVSSDGITGQRYPQLMGTYVLSQYVDDCPLEPTYLLYIHQDDPHKLLAGDSDGWVIGDDWGLWVGLSSYTSNNRFNFISSKGKLEFSLHIKNRIRSLYE